MTRFRLFTLLTLPSLMLLSTCALAQETSAPPLRIRSGVIGGATINIHRGEFAAYDGILECAPFDRATTLGWQAGYLFDVPFTPSFGLSTRLSYWKADGDFTSPNPYPVRVAIDDKTTVPLITEHTLETSLDYVTLDALARWNVVKGLYVAAGPTVAFATRAAYEEEERILEPQGITFQNGEPTRKIIAGNFDEQGTIPARRMLRVAGSVAIGAEIPITERLLVAPEVGYSYGLTNVLSTFDWKVAMLRGGVSVLYAFGDESRLDTLAAPPPQPVLAFDAMNQRADGSRLNYAEVTVEEERASDVIPLLPYLFFAPNSSQIPTRYSALTREERERFSEESLHDSVLGVYHHLLDIVGSRMQRHTSATLTITGCREPLDDVGATNALSSARAAAVKEYLVSVWGIAPDRISTTAQGLPAIESYRTSNDGREENRRAELRSSDPRILAPVTRRFSTRTIDPHAVAIVPSIQFGESIASWSVGIVGKEGRVLWETSGSGAPATDLLWSPREEALAGEITGASSTLTARFEATTMSGATLHAERAIPVRRMIRSRRFNGEIVRDSLIERYSMIFFDYNTPRISAFNEDVVGMIQSRMRTSSSVGITGLTDRVGEEAHNDALSVQRASSVAGEVRSRIVPERMHAAGAGEHLIYNNDLPEGRMYNRTVIIEIATPEEDAR